MDSIFCAERSSGTQRHQLKHQEWFHLTAYNFYYLDQISKMPILPSIIVPHKDSISRLLKSNDTQSQRLQLRHREWFHWYQLDIRPAGSIIPICTGLVFGKIPFEDTVDGNVDGKVDGKVNGNVDVNRWQLKMKMEIAETFWVVSLVLASHQT